MASKKNYLSVLKIYLSALKFRQWATQADFILIRRIVRIAKMSGNCLGLPQLPFPIVGHHQIRAKDFKPKRKSVDIPPNPMWTWRKSDLMKGTTLNPNRKIVFLRYFSVRLELSVDPSGKFAKWQQSGLSFSLQPVSSTLGPVFKLIKLGWGNLGYVFFFIYLPA